ncbi:DNA/RNA nuclease SfsA [Nitratifractor salsuginis]|uniref:Sugar fermentation stimulation protein homolog n=1 Tax=Nitratifractor salsuginis (strain DSM 16511 / JCM 12458 / E9I37-1) TaxID=749222 RepID=E6WXP3_NITSE|nr:DNA/RNA nuclease SfsA [Nitratifractor salsuginis]ADV46300.1 sugar fermentation stimulation protein [Nitratifractor salsuginis DSM 16511]
MPSPLSLGTPLYDLSTLGPLTTGIFLDRPNRFVAEAETEEGVRRVHVADTGRLEEILTPGRPLLLRRNPPGMRTSYTLIAAKMQEGWVLINTRLHRPIARRAIELGVLGFLPSTIREEVSFGESRLDYRADDTFVELKGCSLVQEGLCLFPNTPTTRGTRHIRELIAAVGRGYKASLLIMGLRPCRCFAPHPERDPEFRKAFYEALDAGVGFRGFHVGINEELRVIYDGDLKLCK